MVYESDFYTSRRPYTRPTPSITSYTVTTPRHYVVTDYPERPRRAEEQYSYSYTTSSESKSSTGGSVPPTRNYSSSTERVQRSTGSGPGSTYHSTSERTSRSSDYPGSYNHSYSSTTSEAEDGFETPHSSSWKENKKSSTKVSTESHSDDCEVDSDFDSEFEEYLATLHPDQAHTYQPGSIPHIAHKRLNYTSASTPPRTKKAQLYAELDRINHRNFNDETRSIRAQTAALLKRVHTPTPRAVRPLPISGTFDHVETAIPERITSDDYINRMIDPMKYPTLAQEENQKRVSIGKGHLACMSFAGGRGYPRRKYLISPEEREEQRHIKDEILYRSYYDKFRTITDDSSGEDKGPGAH